MTRYKDYGERYLNVATAQDDYVFTRGRRRFCLWAASGDTQEFVVCDLLLEAVLNAAQPGPEGWHGILLEYHCNLDWLDASWPIPDVAAVISTLASVPGKAIAAQPFGNEALTMLPELLEFLAEAVATKQPVILSKT